MIPSHLELQPNTTQTLSRIKLEGYPYQQETSNRERIDATETLELLAANSGYRTQLPDKLAARIEELTPLISQGYNGLYLKVSKGEEFDFSTAYSLMACVCAGTNNQLDEELEKISGERNKSNQTKLFQSVALLSAMSAKEGYASLNAEEIAGLVAAALELDTVARVPSDFVTAYGGMGGDEGYKKNGNTSKLFSSSTLSALVLANRHRVHKHHSYPNTSKVAGQSAVEAFGARSDFQTFAALEYMQNTTGLLMTSCHSTRTLHTISHLLRGETINHVVGPLAFCLDKDTTIQGMIGVNEKVHPQITIDTLGKLSDRNVQKYGNSVAFCGLSLQDKVDIPNGIYDPNEYNRNKDLKKVVRVDEVAPPPFLTLAAFRRKGQSVGSFIISPSDFMDSHQLERVHIEKLLIKNDRNSIMQANEDAIRGNDFSKAAYIAMNVGLGIFTREYLEHTDALDLDSRQLNRAYLRECYGEALEYIMSGKSQQKLQEYVLSSQNVCSKQVPNY